MGDRVQIDIIDTLNENSVKEFFTKRNDIDTTRQIFRLPITLNESSLENRKQT